VIKNAEKIAQMTKEHDTVQTGSQLSPLTQPKKLESWGLSSSEDRMIVP